MTMDQYGTFSRGCILLLIALTCVTASGDAWRPKSTAESSPPLLRSLLMSSSIVNEINHNHNRNHNGNGSSININALSTQSQQAQRSEYEPISEPVSQSQYYYYQQRLFRPNVNLRISSEYGIVRRHQLPANKDKDDYFVYTTGTAVGASASPNSIIDRDSDGKDKGKAIAKDRYSEKVIIEPQQSTLESPIEQEQLQYHRSTDQIHLHTPPPVAESDSGHHPSDSLNPRPESHRPRVRVSYEHVDVDPSSSASAAASALASSSSLVDVDTLNSNADKDKGGIHTVTVTDKSEKLNAIVVNEPPSAPAPGSTNVDYDDDYSNYYHYDDDYQQQQYSHSFPDYTDEELLENVADTAEIHNQYFVKTKPRDVITQIETSLSPLALPEDGLDGHSYNAYLHASLNETGARTTGTTPTTMQEQDSSDFYENMPFAINKANKAPSAAAVNNPHSMKLEMFPSGPTMASISAQEESTKMLDDAEYGLMMTPTIASNLIADVTRKFGSTDSTSIPGMPGIDYPILDEIPQTSFDCQKQRYKGFFADVETKCQAWHYCDFIDGHSTFLCPNGTLFSQTLLTCDWWFKVRCEESQQLYVLNERLYRYIKAPKLSFPEDFHGPHVDDFLLEQLQLGLLPKIKKKVKDKVVIQEKYS